MKSFEQFLEATAIAPKDVKSVADKSASSDKMAQKLTQIQQRRQNERIKQGKVSAPAQTRAGKALPAGKPGGALATSKGNKLATTSNDEPGALTTPKTKQRVASGSAGEPRLDRDKAVSGKYSRGKGNKPIDDRKRAALDKLKKPKQYKGFVGGLKSSLGGDVVSKNDEERAKSREELGRKTGRAIRSAPGKAVKGVASLVSKAVRNSASQNKGAGSVPDAQDTSYNNLRDTQV